ncbi:MAG TPA: Kazal-type serine protease inhibitor domain-containing protein [Kofleriaceae bacterium]|nr:Kazal-type serine protease inhibitor domain-containing protein [Kofleriaceae bacterium]
MKLRSLCFFTAALSVAACMDKVEPGKGEIEEESPPGTPLPGPSEGKGDGEAIRATISVESAHPYANNLNKTYAVSLAGRVPSCARRARLHFATLRTEAGYDYLSVEGPYSAKQTFDGSRDNTWSQWFELDQSLALTVRLQTDSSVTRDGFRIDSVEVEASVICPAVAIRVCESNQLDTNASRGTCECPRHATCVADTDVSFEHAIGGGFTGEVNGKRAVGTTAYTVKYKPGQDTVVTQIGTIDHARLQATLRKAVDNGLLLRPDSVESSNWNETLQISLSGALHSFVRPQGTFPAADAEVITEIDRLFECGTGGALTCGSGFTCDAGACVPQSQGCVCAEIYQPVCGNDGHTYGNACKAACAQAGVRHDGECGIDGDMCGGISGAQCAGGRCRYAASTWEAPHPDAAGVCRGYNYCDAPQDCGWTVRPAGPGSWTCAQNACSWTPQTLWTDFSGFRFETAHPYANSASDWRQVYLPAGAAKMRLLWSGTFALETNYDFLEVHTWDGAKWVLTKRYTGTVGPGSTDEFTGRYFYLRLASDSSVTKHGFNVTVQYAN